MCDQLKHLYIYWKNKEREIAAANAYYRRLNLGLLNVRWKRAFFFGIFHCTRNSVVLYCILSFIHRKEFQCFCFIWSMCRCHTQMHRQMHGKFCVNGQICWLVRIMQCTKKSCLELFRQLFCECVLLFHNQFTKFTHKFSNLCENIWFKNCRKIKFNVKPETNSFFFKASDEVFIVNATERNGKKYAHFE